MLIHNTLGWESRWLIAHIKPQQKFRQHFQRGVETSWNGIRPISVTPWLCLVSRPSRHSEGLCLWHDWTKLILLALSEHHTDSPERKIGLTKSENTKDSLPICTYLDKWTDILSSWCFWSKTVVRNYLSTRLPTPSVFARAIDSHRHILRAHRFFSVFCVPLNWLFTRTQHNPLAKWFLPCRRSPLINDTRTSDCWNGGPFLHIWSRGYKSSQSWEVQLPSTKNNPLVGQQRLERSRPKKVEVKTYKSADSLIFINVPNKRHSQKCLSTSLNAQTKSVRSIFLE